MVEFYPQHVSSAPNNRLISTPRVRARVAGGRQGAHSWGLNVGIFESIVSSEWTDLRSSWCGLAVRSSELDPGR